jgi:tetraacyldisaccharide 4'-kinase
MDWLVNSWYNAHPIRWILAPLSGVYRLVMQIRKYCYQQDVFTRYKATAPVIIVGNITAGGTGKTPFVIWLCQQFKQAGYRPGVISRGYGGNYTQKLMEVTLESDPRMTGDEPVVISSATQCPVIVSADRKASCEALVTHHGCNIIISDDGLQHYRLQRDVEIVIVDGKRLFGNEYCLPAGPLREPLTRLEDVDFTVFNAGHDHPLSMHLKHSELVQLTDHTNRIKVDGFAGQTVHAVAGIGNPHRFFEQLRSAGLTVIEHAFADHHDFQKSDLEFNDQKPIIMTEKDAVKCRSFSDDRCWYVATETIVTDHLFDSIHQLIRNKRRG